MNQERKLAIALIGGDWNLNGGRESSYVNILSVAISAKEGLGLTTMNGGHFKDLKSFVENERLFANYDVILWMANVPNDLPKYRDVKEIHPHKLLVTTKRNNGEYSFQELTQRALAQKANLAIDFRKRGDGLIEARLFDPLGVVWQDYTAEIDTLAKALVDRLRELASFTRQKTIQESGNPLAVPNETEFFGLIKKDAEIFHELIAPADGITRFLGNSAFRCQRGFPGFRDAEQNKIFISRRNVDKRYIDPSSFVAVELTGEEVRYWGPAKPSVDTPIQVRLFKLLPKVNYMLHGHVYVKDAPTTARPVSCGAIEEIKKLITGFDEDFYCVNLLGHGFIAMSSSVKNLENLSFVPRKFPEIIKN